MRKLIIHNPLGDDILEPTYGGMIDLHSDAVTLSGWPDNPSLLLGKKEDSLILYKSKDAINWERSAIINIEDNTYRVRYPYFSAMEGASDDVGRVGREIFVYYNKLAKDASGKSNVQDYEIVRRRVSLNDVYEISNIKEGGVYQGFPITLPIFAEIESPGASVQLFVNGIASESHSISTSDTIFHVFPGVGEYELVLKGVNNIGGQSETEPIKINIVRPSINYMYPSYYHVIQGETEEIPFEVEVDGIAKCMTVYKNGVKIDSVLGSVKVLAANKLRELRYKHRFAYTYFGNDNYGKNEFEFRVLDNHGNLIDTASNGAPGFPLVSDVYIDHVEFVSHQLQPGTIVYPDENEKVVEWYVLGETQTSSWNILENSPGRCYGPTKINYAEIAYFGEQFVETNLGFTWYIDKNGSSAINSRNALNCQSNYCDAQFYLQNMLAGPQSMQIFMGTRQAAKKIEFYPSQSSYKSKKTFEIINNSNSIQYYVITVNFESMHMNEFYPSLKFEYGNNDYILKSIRFLKGFDNGHVPFGGHLVSGAYATLLQ